MPGRHLRAAMTAMLAVALSSPWAMALAQQEPEAEPGGDEPIEEIVVVANKDGDPIDLDVQYAEQLKARIIEEYQLLQTEQEEEQWRKTLPTAIQQPGSRIKWGYDAQSEARMRRQTNINDLPIDNVKPATIISVGF